MVEQGYARYACDRAESAHAGGVKPIAFMAATDKEAGKWIDDVTYTDGNGVEMRMTLCPECAAKYLSILSTHQRDMIEFAEEGLQCIS